MAETPWWAVALAVGLVGAGAMWAIQANAPEREPATHVGSDGTTTTGPAPVPDVLLPFASYRADYFANVSQTMLVLAPHGRAAAEAWLAKGNATNETLEWQSESVALYDAHQAGTGFCTRDFPPSMCGPVDGWPLPWFAGAAAQDGPRLFHDGYNATRVTAYIFDEAGLLLASNANDTDRFELHGDFTRLPSSAWYLGANDTAPNGTVFLPGLAQPLVNKVRPLLDGLPEGGVASTRSNAYVNLFGSLFVTVRIDELVHAP